MHEDEARRIRDSGDEGIGQGQTTWCGISQTDRSEAGFGVHRKEGGQVIWFFPVTVVIMGNP